MGELRYRELNYIGHTANKGFSRWLSGKEPTCQCRRHKRCRFDPWVWKIPWRREGQATHSSILAWRIPRTEELGGLQSMGLQRVGHKGGNLGRVHSKIFSYRFKSSYSVVSYHYAKFKFRISCYFQWCNLMSDVVNWHLTGWVWLPGLFCFIDSAFKN